MSWQENDHVTRSVLELGDPDALYRVRPGRFFAKLALGVSLLLFGVIGNYIWWMHGPATFGHLELFVLIILPLMGATLLWHMYRNRGLNVLVYPSGLLRLLRGEVDSFPWHDIATVHIKTQNAGEPVLERNEQGELVACWLPAEAPMFQIWNAGVIVTRSDGVDVHLGPALSDYNELAADVQRRSFAVQWPAAWSKFQEGIPLLFDDLMVSSAGITFEKNFITWRQLGDVGVSQGKLSIKQSGKWLPWRLRDISAVANPHLLMGLLIEGKREMTRKRWNPEVAEIDEEEEDELYQ